MVEPILHLSATIATMNHFSQAARENGFGVWIKWHFAAYIQVEQSLVSLEGVHHGQPLPTGARLLEKRLVYPPWKHMRYLRTAPCINGNTTRRCCKIPCLFSPSQGVWWSPNLVMPFLTPLRNGVGRVGGSPARETFQPSGRTARAKSRVEWRLGNDIWRFYLSWYHWKVNSTILWYTI